MKTPVHLWIVGIVSLLWNAGGAFDWAMTMTKNEGYMANFSPEQLEYFYGLPMWVNVAWSVAIVASVLGSLMLLMRSRMAIWAFIVALVGMIGNMIYGYLLSETSMTKMMGMGAAIFSLVIFFAAVFLIWYARKMKMQGVLR